MEMRFLCIFTVIDKIKKNSRTYIKHIVNLISEDLTIEDGYKFAYWTQYDWQSYGKIKFSLFMRVFFPI